MLLSISTPEKKLFEGEIQKINLPGSNGSFQILKDHAHLFSLLIYGKVSYITDDGSYHYMELIDGGCVEVKENVVELLVW